MTETFAPVDARKNAPAWGAVFALSVTVAALLTSELLPASLLTLMARSLGVSEGLAGQSVTATAFAAVFASLFVGRATRRLDRRVVVMSFSALLVVSNLIVAFAPNFPALIVGRLLLGLALGGFWAMAASLAMRLVPARDVPKALSIVFTGVSVAMVAAAPLGTLLGEAIGWRAVFLSGAALGAACWLWQALVLPSMPAPANESGGGVWQVARRPGMAVAMTAVFTVFAGQFAFFTYMRPFYESWSGLGVGTLPAVLLAFGLANLVGTALAAPLLRRSLKLTLAVAPLILGACGIGLLAVGASVVATFALTAVWGAVFGAVPVGWSTWVTTNAVNDAESAGGLQVAVIQVANTAGAALGGLALDQAGPGAPVAVAALLLLATSVLVWAGVRRGDAATPEDGAGTGVPADGQGRAAA